MHERNTKYKVNSPSVVYETIDGETILMNLANGFYFSFDGIGAVIWELLMLHASPDDIAGLLQHQAANAPSDIQQNIESFVTQLNDNELLVPDTNPASVFTATEESTALLSQAGAVKTPPKLFKYTDMKDVLLLDPIHEVDKRGWPEPRKD
jgi:hypothetical protein